MSSLSPNTAFHNQNSSNAQHDVQSRPVEDDMSGSESPYRPATPTRGSRESSPARSEYATSIPEVDAPTKSVVTVLDVFHSKSKIDLRIHDASGKCIYFVENDTLVPNKPDVILWKGNDKNSGAIAGVARWGSMLGKTVEIGLGDPGTKYEHANNLVWEKMASTSHIRQKEHKWSMQNDPEHHVYVWKRTRHVGVEEEHNSWSALNFKLVDDKTNQVLATFATNWLKSWSKMGKITIRQDLGGDWELMVILSCLALIEKSRRRARARRSHGGGS